MLYWAPILNWLSSITRYILASEICTWLWYTLFCCSYVTSTWRHQMEIFPHYWPFVKGIHRSPVDSSNKGQWRGALMFSLMCTSTNGWANCRDTGNLRRHGAHCDVTVIISGPMWCIYPYSSVLLLWLEEDMDKITWFHNMVTWWWNPCRITDPLFGESSGHQYIPLTKGQLCGALIFS